MHVGFEVDEEVWLTPEDVAKGEDTVVKRAIVWIEGDTTNIDDQQTSPVLLFYDLAPNTLNLGSTPTFGPLQITGTVIGIIAIVTGLFLWRKK